VVWRKGNPVPRRSDIEAAQLLQRLIESRHGEVPAWAKELASSKPDEATDDDASDHSPATATRAIVKGVMGPAARVMTDSAARDWILHNATTGRVERRVITPGHGWDVHMAAPNSVEVPLDVLEALLANARATATQVPLYDEP
jgi:hypothetical protein